MALTRLLRAKHTIQFSRIGYTNSVRWYSSSIDGEIDKSSKKGVAAREEKEKAVESYVNKYMQENPGVFPKPSYVQKEVGGNWYTVKSIIQNLKEKILGNADTQLHDPSPNIDSKATEGPNRTEVHEEKVIVSPIIKGPNKTEVHDEKVIVSPIMKDNLSGDTLNHMVTKAIGEKKYPDNLDHDPSINSKAVNLTVTEAITEKEYLGDPKIDTALGKEDIPITSGMRDLQNIFSKVAKSSTKDGFLDNLEFSKSSVKTEDSVGESRLIAKILREDVGQANIRSDVPKITNVKSGEKAKPLNFDNDLISKSNELSSHSLKDSFVERLRQIGYGNQEEKKMKNSSPGLSNLFGKVRKGQATSQGPNQAPSRTTSQGPSQAPSRVISQGPSQAPSRATSQGPSQAPSRATSQEPSQEPSQAPSRVTSQGPSQAPSRATSQEPSKAPSQATVNNIFTTNLESSKTLQELVEMKLTSSEYINNQSSPSEAPSQKESLIHTNEEVTPDSPQENSVSGEAKSSDLKGLVDCIKVLPIGEEGRIVKPITHREYKKIVETKSSNPDRVCSALASVKRTDMENDTNFNTLNLLNSPRVPLKMTDMENKERVDTDFKSLNSPSSTWAPPKMIENEPDQSQSAGQNKVKLMCLPKTATKMDMYNAFRSSGEIERVQFIYTKGNNASGLSADVHFKTVNGVKKALELRHVTIHDEKVTVAESPTMSANVLHIPNLISDPFSGYTKNPRRTVVIKNLTPDISYHQLEEALSFCGSNISAISLASSSKSLATVEFETEEGKEKALTKHAVDVLGQQFLLSRIDAPRTTVVRLSNMVNSYNIVQKIKPICESFGKVAAVKLRYKSIVDVYFELNEWPNMRHILNSLNGMEIGPERLVAAPAPIYPPEILRALWNHPEEKKHVKAVVRNLIQKLGQSSMNMVAVADTAAALYRD